MEPTSSLPHSSASLLRLLLAASWLILPISSPAQTAEVVQNEALPIESSEPPSSSAADPTAAGNCCPPLPAQEPGGQDPNFSGPAGKNSGNDANSSQACGPSDTDPANLKKARWPTRTELARIEAATTIATDTLPNGSFPDRPAWVLAMGDRSATDGTGRAALPPEIQYGPWDVNHQAQPLTAANERIVQSLTDQVNVQAYAEAHGKPLLTFGLCRSDWEYTLSRSGIDLPAEDYLFASSPSWRKNHGLEQALQEGNLAAADPNWVEIPPNEIQMGDTFVIAPYYDAQKDKVKDGHIGFAGYSVPAGRWVGISTNVNGDPRWTAVPLEGFPTGGKAIRFFRWIGPLKPKPNP